MIVTDSPYGTGAFISDCDDAFLAAALGFLGGSFDEFGRFAPSPQREVGDGFAPSPPPPLGHETTCFGSARSAPSRRSVAQGSHAKRCFAGCAE